MSTGPDRGEKRRGLVARTRTGQGKPHGEGLTIIPRAALPTLWMVLEKEGWLGIIPACCICHLSGAEIMESQIEENELIVFSGGRTRRFPLTESDAKHVEQLLDKIARAVDKENFTESRKRNFVAEFLNRKIQPAVRKHLARTGNEWSKHVNINITTLHRLGAEQLVAGWGTRREFVRAYFRSPRAHPEDVLPDATEEIMRAYDSAVEPFWRRVDTLLTQQARTAIARLADAD